MRTTVHLQERHLAEAVRRKVITEEQLEGILGVARSMSPAESAAPDLRWVTVVHGAAALVAVGIPAAYLLDKMTRLTGLELFAASALAAAGSWFVGLVLRRAGIGRVPASIFTAAAAAFTWGIGAAAWIVARHGMNTTLSALAGDWHVYDHTRLCAYLAGSAAALVAALAIGGIQRVPAAAAVGAMAAVHLAMGSGELLATMDHGYFSSREASPWLLAIGVAMLAVGRLMDRRFRGRADAAFWVHLFGLMPLGLGAAMRIDRAAVEGLLWIPVAALVGALGIKWDRRVYLLASAAALLIFPAFALGEANAGDTAVVGAFVVSVLSIGIAASWLRGYYTRVWIQAPGRSLDRTVWE